MKTFKDHYIIESTAEYAKSLEKIANDRKLKSLSKKDKETLSRIADLMKNANEDVNEAPLVMGDLEILDTIMNKIKGDIAKDKLKGKFEKHWPNVQALAKMAGFGITKSAQANGKTFRYDLKK
jgi:hypothetical protein